MTTKHANTVEALLDRHGTTFAEELGIDLAANTHGCTSTRRQ